MTPPKHRATWDETVAAGVVFAMLGQSVPDRGLNIGVDAISLHDGCIDITTARGKYRLTVTKLDADTSA